MKFNNAINAFSSGEFSSDLRARFDLPQYKQAISNARNVLLERTGGVTRREGTIIKWLKYNSLLNKASYKKYCLIPLTFKDNIIFLYIPLNYSGTTSDWRWLEYSASTKKFTEHTFRADSNYSTLYAEQVADIQYAQLGNTLVIVDTTGKSEPVVFEFLEGIAGSTYPNDEIKYLGFQAYVGTEYPTWVTWKKPNNNTALTMTVIGHKASYEGKRIPAASRTTTCTITSNLPFFTEAHVGKFIRINIDDSSNHREGIALITVYTDKNNVKALEWVGFNKDSVASDDWSLSSINVDTNNADWFTSVTTFQDRILLGGPNDMHDTVYSSIVGNFKILMDYKLYQDASTDYSGCRYYGEVKATDAFATTITGQEGLIIKFISGANIVVVGTNTRVFVIRPTDASGYGPTTVEVVSEKAVACGSVQAAQTNQGLAFVSADHKRIYIGKYVDNSGEFLLKDATLLNSDIIANKGNNWNELYYDFNGEDKDLKSTITALSWDSTNARLYASNNFGGYSVLTLEEGAKTLGWTRNVISSYKADTDTAPFNRPENAHCLMPVKHPLYNAIFFACNDGTYSDTDGYVRYPCVHVGGASEIYLVYNNFKLHLDSCFETDKSDIKTDTGGLYDYWVLLYNNDSFDYGKIASVNQEVYYVIKRKVDVYGVVTAFKFEYGLTVVKEIGGKWYANIPTTQDEVLIGVKFESKVETLPISIKTNSGTSRGNPSRVDHATLIVDKTASLEVFTNYNSDIIVDQTNESEYVNKDVKVALPHSTEDEVRLGFKTELPLSFSVLGLVLEGVTYDE